MIDFNRINNGDTIEALSLSKAREWEVRYINRSEGWLQVSDEEDTQRFFVYPLDVSKHIPLV